MFCIKCGKENLNDAKFCSNCGALLTAVGRANESVWRVAPSLLQPEETGSAANFAPMPAPPKKRKILPVVLCSVGAALLVLIVVLVFVGGGKLGADPGGVKAAAVVRRMCDAYEAHDIDAFTDCYFPAQRREATSDGVPDWQASFGRIYDGCRVTEEYEDWVRDYLHERYGTPEDKVDAVYIVPLIGRPAGGIASIMAVEGMCVIESDGAYYFVDIY